MTKHSSQFILSLGGKNMPEDMYDAVEEITVDTRLNLPGMFTLRLHDPNLKWVDSSDLAIGVGVEIKAAVSEEAVTDQDIQGAQVLIKGEITALEPNFAADGNTKLIVRGYDKMHRLHRGRKTQTFLDVTDSDLVKKLAAESGLSTGLVDSTSTVYKYVIQYNQTNMEFLMARAERIGYQLFLSDGNLCFKKGDRLPSDSVKLVYLDTLTSFEPRWTSSGQADKLTVNGWDVKNKQAIKGQATPNSSLNQGGMAETGGATAKKAFKQAEEIIVDRQVSDQTDAEKVAQGSLAEISRAFVQAEGECFGHPLLKAGCKVRIEGVGKRFTGNYFVSSALHIYTSSFYTTRFSISERRPDTLSALLQAGSYQETGQVMGVTTALVTNLNDPEAMGRIKVKYAWLGEAESTWARLASPMAGAERGWWCLPEINDEVVIAFEHGDINRPFIIGSLWNGKDKPPETLGDSVAGGKVVHRLIRSRSGHMILLDDSDGKEQIIIRDKTKKNEIIIDSKNNTIKINVDKDLKTTAKGETVIESTGKLTLKSNDDLTIECKNFKVDAQMNADLKANAAVNVQNAAAKIALSGPTVNINNGALEVT